MKQAAFICLFSNTNDIQDKTTSKDTQSQAIAPVLAPHYALNSVAAKAI